MNLEYVGHILSIIFVFLLIIFVLNILFYEMRDDVESYDDTESIPKRCRDSGFRKRTIDPDDIPVRKIRESVSSDRKKTKEYSDKFFGFKDKINNSSSFTEDPVDRIITANLQEDLKEGGKYFGQTLGSVYDDLTKRDI